MGIFENGASNGFDFGPYLLTPVSRTIKPQKVQRGLPRIDIAKYETFKCVSFLPFETSYTTYVEEVFATFSGKFINRLNSGCISFYLD